MKNALLACCVLPLFLSSAAEAGINGTYKVRGSETSGGQKYTFSGTVTVAKFKTASYDLNFHDDGDNAAFKLTFSPALKETTKTQTVDCASRLGTGTATFSYVNGSYKVQFSYKGKGGGVKGSGTGTK